MGNAASSEGTLGRQIAGEMEAITLHKVRELGFRHAKASSERIASAANVLALRDTPLVEGDTALVIAAGPSLHRRDVARQLRESGFSGTLVATESAMGYCLRNGIVPDLIVTLDPHPERIVRWFGDRNLTEESLQADDYYRRQDLEPTFAKELRTNGEQLELVDKYGPRIRAAVCSSAPLAVVDRIYACGMTPYWWNPFYDDYDAPDSVTRKIHQINGLPCLNAGGNVGSAAWVIAQAVLGKRRIGIVGMDFGYYADTPYDRTQYYHEIVDLVGADRLGEVYVPIHNPYLGVDFYTDPAYLWYRDSFLQMVAEAGDASATYNCTEGGILFGDGIHFTPLSDFLASVSDPAASRSTR